MALCLESTALMKPNYENVQVYLYSDCFHCDFVTTSGGQVFKASEELLKEREIVLSGVHWYNCQLILD
jgi:hypothetical protein